MNQEEQKRFDTLLTMYVEHIHEHRLGTGKECEGCRELAIKQLEDRLKGDSNERTRNTFTIR